jgi:hypothetical protein
MPNGDHDKLIDQALAWATEQLRTGGHIPFMVFTIDEQGRSVRADPGCFAGGDSGRERKSLPIGEAQSTRHSGNHGRTDMNINRFLWSAALALVAYSFVLIPAAMAGGYRWAG